MAATDPEPAVVPVNVTEQLVTPEVVDRVQVLELSEPPVVPAVRAKVRDPAGTFEAVVGSAKVAVTDTVQLVAPNAMLQLTFPRLVGGLSFPGGVTSRVGAEVLAGFGGTATTNIAV